MDKIRLLSMDFDGTLVRDWAPPPFPEVLVRTLNRLRQHGVMLALNTGRTLPLVEQGLEFTGFPVRPDFALTTEREVFRWTKSGWEDFGEWNSRCREDHDRLYDQVEALLCEIEAFIECDTAARVHYEDARFAGLIASNDQEMDRICRFIDLRCGEFPAFAYQRNSVYLRFSHAAYHKGSALAELQRLIAVSPGETFAVGDNFNDLSMLNLEFARFLACPSNAISEVRSAVCNQGGFIASQDSGSGVAESLRHFFPSLLKPGGFGLQRVR